MRFEATTAKLGDKYIGVVYMDGVLYHHTPSYGTRAEAINKATEVVALLIAHPEWVHKEDAK